MNKISDTDEEPRAGTKSNKRLPNLVLNKKDSYQINNMIGDVVIIAQEKETAKKQIEARFDNLVPLHDSTCGD